MINKDELKNNLEPEQVYELLVELDAEPQMYEDFIICKTICHKGHTHKLYYYYNTKLFKCFTDCADTFDIFELVIKVKSNYLNEKWELPKAMYYVATYFGIPIDNYYNDESTDVLEDWKIIDFWNKRENKSDSNKKLLEFKIFSDNILKNLPVLKIASWEKEGINYDVLKERGIKYYPTEQVIIIPHYDKDNNLIGIRQRALVEEDIAKGKYRPAIISGKMYNHPLGLNLYNLNNSKENIKILKKAIVFESEKSCLQYASFFGIENDISVACCGSALIQQQVQLLEELDINELVIALDKQYQEIGDNDWKKWASNYFKIYNKYGNKIQISFLVDNNNLLDFKDSPSDKGKEVFLELFKNRVYIKPEFFRRYINNGFCIS